jgi:DNA-binding MarR family transcriptional regulator
VVVELTDAGMQALDGMIATQVPKEKNLFVELTLEERMELNRLLRKVMASFDPSVLLHPPEPPAS